MITSFFKPKRDRKESGSSRVNDNNKHNDGKENGKNDNTENKKRKTTHDTTKSQYSPETLALVSHLKDPSSDQSSGAVVSWKTALDKHFSTPSFRRLASFVDTERYVALGVGCGGFPLFVPWHVATIHSRGESVHRSFALMFLVPLFSSLVLFFLFLILFPRTAENKQYFRPPKTSLPR